MAILRGYLIAACLISVVVVGLLFFASRLCPVCGGRLRDGRCMTCGGS